ncbi:hypothetical protein GCM10025734_58030 [Kitasatospora paranensis]
MRRPRWPRRVFAQLLLSQTVVTIGVTAVTAGLFLAPVSRELDRDAMQRALSIAQATASDDGIARAAAARDSRTVQHNAEQIRRATHAEFVVITDTDGIRLSHTDPSRIGLRVSTDPGPALHGESVTAIQDGTLGRTARGKVPLRLADGRIVGEVSVGLSDDSIRRRLLSMAGGSCSARAPDWPPGSPPPCCWPVGSSAAPTTSRSPTSPRSWWNGRRCCTASARAWSPWTPPGGSGSPTTRRCGCSPCRRSARGGRSTTSCRPAGWPTC